MRGQVVASACLVLLTFLVAAQAQGAAGPTTHVYSKGEKGDPGEKGSAGAFGNRGDRGSNGRQGATGFRGAKGFRGAQGEDGEDGVEQGGATGNTGPQGATGSTGFTGAPGLRGADGQMGVVGPPGAPGVTGDTGVRGSQGEPGQRGDQGAMGATGLPGAQGDQGEQGDTGRQGLPGGQGPRGPPGDSLQSILNAAAMCGPSFQCAGASSCTNTPAGPICMCNAGFDFEAGQGTKCIDINECTHSKCHHGCQNTEGSFRCTCLPGYSLNANGRTCSIAGPRCNCGSEEVCTDIASGPQCLPSTIEMADGANAAIMAAQSGKSADVAVEQTLWINENWIVAFIVWGLILSIVVILLVIWLIYEWRQPTITLSPVTVEYHDINSPAVASLKLAPVPAAYTMRSYQSPVYYGEKVYEPHYGSHYGDIYR